MSKPAPKNTPSGQQDTAGEIRQMREAAQRIAASKTTARRFLAAIGMHQSNGQLKPQFR